LRSRSGRSEQRVSERVVVPSSRSHGYRTFVEVVARIATVQSKEQEQDEDKRAIAAADECYEMGNNAVWTLDARAEASDSRGNTFQSHLQCRI
jgi:hypothetical protein